MGANDIPMTDVEKNGENKASSSPVTAKEKKLLIVVTLLAVLGFALLIALIVLIVLGVKSAQPDLCLTADCVRTASDILNFINESNDPCDDFHKFSCGKWITDHSKDRGSIGTIYGQKINQDIIQFIGEEKEEKHPPASVRKFLKAFQKCVEFDEISPSHERTIRRILKDLGGMPMMEKNWNEDYEWTEAFGIAFNEFKIVSPLWFEIRPNLYNTDENIIYMKMPFLETYKPIDWDMINQVALKLGQNTNYTIAKDIEDLKKMEQFLISITMKEAEVVFMPEEFKITTIGELNLMYPSEDWLPFLQNLFATYLEPIGYSISSQTKVFVMGINKYMPKMLNAIQTGEISERTLANYIASSFLNELFSVHMLAELPAESRNTICYQYFIQRLPFIIDYIYGKYRKEKTMDESMIKYSFKAMENMISEAKWLDSETRKSVYQKLRNMNYHLSFAPFSQDPRKLDQFYEELPDMSDNSFENQLSIETFLVETLSQRINTKNNKKEWIPLPEAGASQSNAFQYHEMNSIYILAGIQIYPYFDANRPFYINFGSGGLVLGHEITHGFDKIGSARDETGSLREWWTEGSKREFVTRTQCFIDQYNKYEYGGGTNKHVDGKSTLSENIADNGGIRQSFMAYKLWEKDHGKEKRLPGLEKYTPYQLFFIAFGSSWCTSYDPEQLYQVHHDDEHSANNFRIIGSLSNMKEFSEAFNCKVGSKMNPEKKCSVW